MSMAVYLRRSDARVDGYSVDLLSAGPALPLVRAFAPQAVVALPLSMPKLVVSIPVFLAPVRVPPPVLFALGVIVLAIGAGYPDRDDDRGRGSGSEGESNGGNRVQSSRPSPRNNMDGSYGVLDGAGRTIVVQRLDPIRLNSATSSECGTGTCDRIGSWIISLPSRGRAVDEGR